MGKSPHFQQGKPSQPQGQGQGQTRIQNPPRSAIQPRMVAPQQGPKPVAPPVYWPQPAPHVLQRKIAGEGQQNGAQAGPAVPPVYHAQQAPNALQTKSAPAVAQMAKCTCHKPGNKHISKCPANPKQKRAKAEKVKVVHQESQSIRNLYAYDSQWANKRGITEKMVKEFVSTYGVIHGHASSRSDKDAKRHDNTTKDIEAFHSWYKNNYE